MESPKRKLQKKNDYQRHKLFRKIKRRRKAQAEADQQVAEKQLRRKLKLPKFGDGKTREVYTSDIHFNNDDAAGGVDRYGNKFDYIEFPETVVTARKIPTFKDIEKQIGRKITQDEIDKVIAVDPQIPIQVAQPIEKGMYSPSITNDKSFNSGKDIHIKSSKRGTFTKAAKQHGMSVQSFANRVLRNPSKYSAAMRKKANFAHNAAGWKH